jgi:hypothetical protein
MTTIITTVIGTMGIIITPMTDNPATAVEVECRLPREMEVRAEMEARREMEVPAKDRVPVTAGPVVRQHRKAEDSGTRAIEPEIRALAARRRMRLPSAAANAGDRRDPWALAQITGRPLLA